MNYHLNRNGQDVGVFTLEELGRRRAAGELAGSEQVWCEGMAQWQPLDSVLQPEVRPTTAKFIAPPPLPGSQPEGLQPVVIGLVILAIIAFLAVAVFVSTGGYLTLRVAPRVKTINVEKQRVHRSAMEAASQRVISDSNSRTQADVQKQAEAFRRRQYLEGYQLRGERNAECDALALQLLTNWVANGRGGIVDTNQLSLAELSDKLADDPNCQDPLLLTVAAVNTAEMRKENRRLNRAVRAFENSKHRAYPKLYATVMLAGDLIQGTNRVPELDSQALQYLKAALTDGSILPSDQSEIGDILIKGWGHGFFNRNAAAVYSLFQDQGDAYQWLALVLEGETEISQAWQVRGNGYVNAVSDAGWKGFSDHLAAARKCLTRAWKLHPELPMAPSRMIEVSLGDSDIGEMRQWFDRTTMAQIDYAGAWREMRNGLLPRWHGDYDSMLAFGVTALNTRRFDTDVPREFYYTVLDLGSELNLPAGQHFFGRDDIWPHLEAMYAGYAAEPTLTPYARDDWRSTYAVVASIAGKYDVARKQLEALNWQPHPESLNNWNRDLSLFPQEVAARTGSVAVQVKDAEHWRGAGDVAGALQLYKGIAEQTNLDSLTSAFVQDRLLTLGREQRLQAGDWVDFMPTDPNLSGWHADSGKFKLQPDGALEVSPSEYGYLIYSRARMGMEFEVRGEFEMVANSSRAIHAGLVMGIPQNKSADWYAFRMERRVATLSEQWAVRAIEAPETLDNRINSFDFRFHNGLVTATVNGHQVFANVAPPPNVNIATNEFMLGLGSYSGSDSYVMRYSHIEARRLSSP